MFIPLLSEYDPAISSEGALDPLGLYSIANKLGTILVPGVRERQIHPRFLTAIAAGAYICSNFDKDLISKDGISEPWQVFEWHIVEGIVRCAENSKQVEGLPGSNKTKDTIKDGLHLNSKRYLKTPSVFGFHGVYRLLARTLHIIDNNGNLDANGYELLKIWEKEQKLNGFTGSDEGEGVSFRLILKDAVQKGIETGAVAKANHWGGWGDIFGHFLHGRPGKKESEYIKNLLIGEEKAFRGKVISYLVSPQGQQVWVSNVSEPIFHKSLAKNAGEGMKELLQSIREYERFARILINAFYQSLNIMTNNSGKTSIKQICQGNEVKTAAGSISRLWEKVSDLLEGQSLSLDFENYFDLFQTHYNIQDFVIALMNHHVKVQMKKPPNGKNPWVEQFDDGTYMVRAAYRVMEYEHEDEDVYVHTYRTHSLWSFAKDLKMV